VKVIAAIENQMGGHGLIHLIVRADVDWDNLVVPDDEIDNHPIGNVDGNAE
jgi:hypothetical protein